MNLTAWRAGIALLLIAGVGPPGVGTGGLSGPQAGGGGATPSAVDTQPVATVPSVGSGAASAVAAAPRGGDRTGAPLVQSARPPLAGEVAVCGSSPMVELELAGLHLGSPAARPMGPALQTIATALASGDALARAAALMLEHAAGLPTAIPEPALQVRIVDLALSSADPDVWMLAQRACLGAQAGNPGPCERLTPQVWADADPGNAAPWLWLMSDSRAAHQSQAADEALYRASQSRFHDARITGLGRLLAHPALDPQAGLPAHLVAIWLVGVQAAYALPSYSGLLNACAAPRLVDANRRLVCDDLARLLIAHSREAIAVSIGFRLAERLQWDADRLQAADDLRLALLSAGLTELSAPEPAGVLDCAGLEDLRQRMVVQAAVGERAHLESLLAARGVSNSDAARPVRAARAATAASAAAAASAAQSTPP